MYKLNVDNVEIPYDIVVNKKLKHMRVSVGMNGVKVSLPYKINLSEIEKFLVSKSGWIHKNFVKFQALKPAEDKRGWIPSDGIMFKDRRFEVVVEEWDRKTVGIQMADGIFKVFVNSGVKSGERDVLAKDALKMRYRDLAREIIDQKVLYYSNAIGVKYNNITIKDQKTRWGSCSKKGNLNFNYRLIMVPEWVLDYVVIHELCHLKHLNHSKEFWNMVRAYMPQYEAAKTWLKNNGIRLFIL